MEALKDWRSPHFEEELAKLDRGGIAFEFLRRNTRYQTEYAEAMRRIAAGGEERSGAIARLSRRNLLEGYWRKRTLAGCLDG